MKKWISVFCVISITYAAIGRSDETIDPTKKALKDSTTQEGNLESKGFKNLFKSDKFNPAEPYSSQINPLAIGYIKDYVSSHGKELSSMKIWAQPYFRMMDNVLISYGIPKELKYLAVIESHLQSWAKSWAGAAGPWQFMPETGRRMGLIINSHVDERANYYRSTQAAAKYLKELYGQLGDWLLVIAAYNSGPGRVFSAIRKSGSKDFWKLQYHLPQESRNHVKKFIGTHYLLEGNGGETTTTADEWAAMKAQTMAPGILENELSPEIVAGTETATLEGKYNSVVLANQIGMDISDFNKLNINFDKMVGLEGGYTLRLPKDKMEIFQANRYIILRQSLMTTLKSAETIGEGFPAASKGKTGTKK